MKNTLGLRIAGSLLLLANLLPSLLLANTTETFFSEHFYGKTLQTYIQDGKKRQDISGAAWDGKRLLLAYDGGNNSVDAGVMLFPPIMKDSPLDHIWEKGNLLTPSVMQRDLEGATYLKGSYFTVASMSLVDEESPGYRLLVEFTLDGENNKIVWERSVDIRGKLIQALKNVCNHKNWHGRMSNVFGMRGGINVEGLSYNPENPNGLIIGLRSPLCSQYFGLPALGAGLSLRKGNAIMAKIDAPFSAKPKFEFISLDLKGHGVRGIEYIPDLQGYVIIGGPVEKANDYTLWFYSDKSELLELRIPGFSKLCRPETVTSATIEGRSSIIIFSEEAGIACENVPFTYIASTIKNPAP